MLLDGVGARERRTQLVVILHGHVGQHAQILDAHDLLLISLLPPDKPAQILSLLLVSDLLGLYLLLVCFLLLLSLGV